MLDLYEELRKLISALDEHKIEYALCGGVAMAVHDHPRATIDIDLLVLAESLDQVLAIANELGYGIRGLEMTFAGGAVEIRRRSKIDRESGHLLSLDFLLVTPEVREVWDSRVLVDREGGKLSVVSRQGLIALKSLRGSLQDQADIAALKEALRDEAN
jgi:hypothetical protein